MLKNINKLFVMPSNLFQSISHQMQMTYCIVYHSVDFQIIKSYFFQCKKLDFFFCSCQKSITLREEIFAGRNFRS